MPIASPRSVSDVVLAPQRHTRAVCPVFVGVLLAGLLGLFLVWRSEFDPSLQRFLLLDDSGECRLYGNPDVMDHQRHQQFIRQNSFDCQHYPWAYLTLYPNVQRVSVLRCREQYSAWWDNQCVMSYYLVGLSHADS